MREWLRRPAGALSRPATVALVGAGLVVATAISDLTDTEGPLGPAGVFFTLVMICSIVSGAAAGLICTAAGAIVILFAFVDDDVAGLADVFAFVVISTLLTLTLGRLNQARGETQRALAQVDAMVQNAPVGMAFVDQELRFREVNETLAELSDITVDELRGTRLDELSGVQPGVVELVRDVLATGRSQLDVPYEGGRGGHVLAGYYPVRGHEGAIVGVGIIVREISAERQRDVLFDRVTRLQELTAALAATGSVAEVIETAVRSVQLAVDARATSFCTVGDETVTVAGSVGYDDETASRWCDFPIGEDVPLADAIRNGAPVLCRSRREVLDRYPHLESSLVWKDSTALAAIPLLGESAVMGAIGLSFYDEREFGGDEVAFLVAVATQCATAYERAHALEAERSARRAAESANDRLRYLAEATKVLSQSLDPETLLQRLAELAVPTLGDWCAVHLVEGDHARPVAMASESAEATALVRDLSERHPVPLDAPAGLGAVVRTGQPIVLRSVTMDAVRASTDETEIVDLLSRLRSIAIVPMTSQGRVLGTVTLSNTTDRELEDDDVALAGELAARAAQAISNARLFQERTLVASTLQASLLPPSPTIIPGVEVATRFVPASEGLEVGGDFYDVFRLGTVDEPAPTWALVIGDVRGKGADAAAITGIARATIRATALDERSPAAMLGRLNQVLLATAEDDRFSSETGEPRFCTACAVTVTPRADGADVVVACGGHPLPYIQRASGDVVPAGVTGDLIGVFGAPEIVDVRVHLAPGDALVLYTDGVTERHEGQVFFDEAGLVEVLRDAVGLDAIALAERIEDRARGFVDATPRDDLAVLVAQIPARAEGGVLGRRFLPDDATSASVARRFVADAVGALGGDTRESELAVLLSSELVTNALLHGAPPVNIEVRQVDGGIRVAVTDEHPDVPAMRPPTTEDEHGRGLLLVEALAVRWGVDASPPGKSVWFELLR